MNGVKNGFSTLNRLLGKKNKDSSLSKSTSNLSHSMSQLNDTTGSSQYNNKIVPLSNMNNAPFEQTFRITVCLPRDQLYVTRLGAKTHLYVLLKMVCDDKQLDINKYEFRHPADNSQAFDNELTIGLVGLNELRLVAKSEKYHSDSFNTDEIVRLRNNHHNISNKSSSLTSPYSSTNSLNSIDSSGMSSSSRGGIVSLHPMHTSSSHHAPVVPMRKKRAAPRPPSQNSIPENRDINFNNNTRHTLKSSEFKEPLPVNVMAPKNFHVSSPNLAMNYNNDMRIITNNNNMKNNYNNNNNNISSSNNNHIKEEQNHLGNGTTITPPPSENNRPNNIHEVPKLQQKRYSSVTELNRIEERKEVVSTAIPSRPTSMASNDSRRVSNGSATTLNATTTTTTTNGHLTSSEAINHSRTSSDSSDHQLRLKKRAPPAPQPQPRNLPPVPSPRSKTEKEENSETESVRSTASSTSENVKSKDIHHQSTNSNVSKVMLNVGVIDEQSTPVKLSKSSSPSSPPESSRVITSKIVPEKEKERPVEPPQSPQQIEVVVAPKVKSDTNKIPEIIIPEPAKLTNGRDYDDSQSIQSVVSSEGETSSNDDVNVYNVKLGQTNLKSPVSASPRAQSPLWTYTLPAPPNFADNSATIATTVATNGETNTDFNDYQSTRADDSQTVISDSTVVSDVDIKPVIIEKLLPPVSNLYNEKLHSSALSTSSSSSGGGRQQDVINSDIEDGYRGGKRGILAEKIEDVKQQSRDENKMIENEFEFLSHEVDEEDIESDTPEETRSIDVNFVKVPVKSTSLPIQNNKHVMLELNSVIADNKIDTIIRRASQEDAVVKNAMQSNQLTNFQLTTYNDEAQKSAEKQERRTSEEKTREFVQIRRRSSNISSPRRISRSGSFHSTSIDTGDGDSGSLLTRSVSHVSLTENGLAPRRSSSELSIHESPSLQSLEVMKLILAGGTPKRKSIEEEKIELPPKIEVVTKVAKKIEIVPKIVEVIQKPREQQANIIEVANKVQEYEIIEVPKVEPVKVVEPPAVVVAKPKETKSDWKYQGPPAFNFSSWSERPKVQVAIKNDRDYKFGGSSKFGDVTNKNENEVLPPQPKPIQTAMHVVEEKYEKQPHLPIVRSVEYKKTVIPIVPEQKKVPEPVAVVAPPEQVVLRSAAVHQDSQPQTNEGFQVNVAGHRNDFGQTAKPDTVNKPNFYTTFSRPNSIAVSRPSQNVLPTTPAVVNVTTTTSAPVISKFQTPVATNNFKMQQQKFNPVVRGFKVDITKEEPITAETKAEKIEVTLRPFTTQQKPTSRYSSYETTAPPPVQSTLPFGQNTLRRTGLKDKILALGNNEQKLQTPPAASAAPVPQFHIKQQDTKIKITTNGTAHGFVSVNPSVTNVVTTSPPPPPPVIPPIVRGVVVKKSNIPLDIDPRDQLLSAIQNFNRESLKRS